MSRIGEPMIFEDLPYILQDEFGFVVEDWLEGAGPDWNPEAPRRVFKDDGKGYAAPAHILLQGENGNDRNHTWRVELDGEAFVWAFSTEVWCIVGEDL